jgi:hypothetical protein
MINAILLDANDALIGIAYVWISFEIVRLVWSSELVSKLKNNKELGTTHFSLYHKIMINTYCFATSFFFCGLTHVSVLDGL